MPPAKFKLGLRVNGTALVVLANLGPDLGQSGYTTRVEGDIPVGINFGDLGLGSLSNSWGVTCIWCSR